MTLYTRLFILLVLFLFITSAYAEQKIAFVNQAQLLKKAPQAEFARNKLQKEFAKRDKALVKLQQEIIKKEKKLKKDAVVLSSDELNKLQRKIMLLKRDLERDKLAFKEDVSIRQNEELVKLQKSVLESIQIIAKKEKYDLIMSDGVIYASSNIDITEKILTQLKKQYSRQ
ncbi:MAG: OmpH family outer membrane protein [Gammaproteobacteria bacterium]|nr:OmpH family outer membrane protein [Gammaproteobacteria bacterium]